MKAVHLSLTPVAGSPIRIVNALNQHTSVRARFIVLDPLKYGRRLFENDLIWDHDKEECLEEIASADVLHLHNWIRLSSNDFGVDFNNIIKQKAKIFRHLHGAPLKVVPSKSLVNTLLEEDIFQICPAQFQERFYPKATILPNIIPVHDPLYQPKEKKSNEIWQMAYSPTTFIPAFGDRWYAKAAPETQRLLKRLENRHPKLKSLIIRNKPHDEAMKLRAGAHIAIDEMVTGSYHISSLESLAVGLPTYTFLDERCIETVKTITGAEELPWMNCKLEHFEDRIIKEIQNPELLMQKGQESHEWIRKYWDDAKWAALCEKTYHHALSSTRKTFESRFDPSDKQVIYQIKTRFDQDWNSRKKRQALSEKIRNKLSIWRSMLRALSS